VINKWTKDSVVHSGTIQLEAGEKYKIKIEYFEDTGDASCVFEWESKSQPRQIVPQSQLYSKDQLDFSADGTEYCHDAWIYPNPVLETLRLANLDLPVDMIILNADGRPVITSHGTSMDVRSLHPGTYYLKIKSQSGSQVFRFIKQ
jgi:hypothetical protein